MNSTPITRQIEVMKRYDLNDRMVSLLKLSFSQDRADKAEFVSSLYRRTRKALRVRGFFDNVDRPTSKAKQILTYISKGEPNDLSI